MTITRPSAMTDQEVERLNKLIERMEERGGSITIHDPRVSQLQTWLIGLVGIGIIAGLGWLANSVDNLNRNFERLAVTQEYMERRLTALEQRQ